MNDNDFAFWCAECSSETNWTMCRRCAEEEKIKDRKRSADLLRAYASSECHDSDLKGEVFRYYKCLMDLAERIERGQLPPPKGEGLLQ